MKDNLSIYRAMEMHIRCEAMAREMIKKLSFWDYFFKTAPYKAYINLLCDIIELKQFIDRTAEYHFPHNLEAEIHRILKQPAV